MAIFDLHHPLLFTFGVLGNIVSLFVYLAPLPTFIQICRKKSTMGFQSLPYVVALFSSMLWLYYASLKSNAILLISINTIGCIIESIYIVIFLVYAPKKARRHTVMLLSTLNAGLFFSILLVTHFLVKSPCRLKVVGWVCVAIAVGVFVAPLSIVFQIVRTRSVEFMPFTLSLSLTLTAIMWFAYGLLQEDWYITIPNVLGFFLGVIQMLLYGIYRNASNKEKVEKEKKVAEHIINMVMVGTPDQVHPIDPQKCGSDDDDDDDDGVKDDEREKEDQEHEQTDKHDHEKNVGSVSIEVEPTQPNVQLETPVLVMCTA